MSGVLSQGRALHEAVARAYQSASAQLLGLLREDSRLLDRLRALKTIFLCAQARGRGRGGEGAGGGAGAGAKKGRAGGAGEGEFLKSSKGPSGLRWEKGGGELLPDCTCRRWMGREELLPPTPSPTPSPAPSLQTGAAATVSS